MLSGRMKANQTIGTGKLEVFDNLKQHFGNDDGHSHISMFNEKRTTKKQERGLVENDEAFKAYENLNEREEAKEKKKDKKKKKDKQEKQHKIANVLEKHVKSLKVKEIRPLHLDAMDNDKLKDYFKKSKNNFCLKYYDNRPLKRLSSLFTRSTQIKLREVEDHDIDFCALQTRNNDRDMEDMDNQEGNTMIGGSDKLFEKYLGLDSEAGTENTAIGTNFQQNQVKKKTPRLEMNSLVEQFGNEM